MDRVDTKGVGHLLIQGPESARLEGLCLKGYVGVLLVY
jgi:hypothetical protein